VLPDGSAALVTLWPGRLFAVQHPTLGV